MGIDVMVFMGSASDQDQMRPALEVLSSLQVAWEVHVTSAHRTPERTSELVRSAEEAGARAVLCGAGMAAHLAGVVAAQTRIPVLGVPLKGGMLDGLDALMSTVQMPPGVPVATFGVGSAGARNAAYFAARIVAQHRPEVAQALDAAWRAAQEKVLEGDREVRRETGGKA